MISRVKGDMELSNHLFDESYQGITSDGLLHSKSDFMAIDRKWARLMTSAGSGRVTSNLWRRRDFDWLATCMVGSVRVPSGISVSFGRGRQVRLMLLNPHAFAKAEYAYHVRCGPVVVRNKASIHLVESRGCLCAFKHYRLNFICGTTEGVGYCKFQEPVCAYPRRSIHKCL